MLTFTGAIYAFALYSATISSNGLPALSAWFGNLPFLASERAIVNPVSAVILASFECLPAPNTTNGYSGASSKVRARPIAIEFCPQAKKIIGFPCTLTAVVTSDDRTTVGCVMAANKSSLNIKLGMILPQLITAPTSAINQPIRRRFRVAHWSSI